MPSNNANEITLADCGYPITFAWIDAIATALQIQIRWPAEVTRYRLEILGCRYPTKYTAACQFKMDLDLRSMLSGQSDIRNSFVSGIASTAKRAISAQLAFENGAWLLIAVGEQ